MLCRCHGEPAYWQKDPRKKRGGYWECAVKRRAYSRAAYEKRGEKKLQQMRDKYDSDPVWRIENLLRNAARRRRQTIERRRANLVSDHGWQ